MSVNELAEEYVKEKDLPDEEKLREILLQKQELKLRSRVIFLLFMGFTKKLQYIEVDKNFTIMKNI